MSRRTEKNTSPSNSRSQDKRSSLRHPPVTKMSRSDFSTIEGQVRQSMKLPIDADPDTEYAMALAKLYDEGYPDIPHRHEGDNGEPS